MNKEKRSIFDGDKYELRSGHKGAKDVSFTVPISEEPPTQEPTDYSQSFTDKDIPWNDK